MKKNIIKIGVPILVFLSIIAWIVSTQKPIIHLSSEMHIDAFDFKTYVDNYIADSISGKPKRAAQKAYAHVYDIINTEAAIVQRTSSGSNSLLSSEDAEALYEHSFKTYFTIFEAEANQLFLGHTWEDIALMGIQSEAESLLGRQGAASGKDSLEHYIKYVNYYHDAVKLINKSKACSKKSSYDYYRNQAKLYQGYPYCNNSNLRNILSIVTNNAQAGWKNAITREINSIKGLSESSFSSYADFYNNIYTQAIRNIREYNTTTNQSWGSNLINDLNGKDANVKKYFATRDSLLRLNANLPSYD